MKPDSEWDRRESPRPWSMTVIGENMIREPVCNVIDARGHSVAEYLAVGDAELIVRAVNGAPA